MPLEAVAADAAPADDVQAIARYFKVLSDGTRLQILGLLLEGDRNVSELVRGVGGSQSRVSNHLACLRWCQIVNARRSGREVVYSVADPGVGRLIAAAAGAIREEQKQRLACCPRIGSEPS